MRPSYAALPECRGSFRGYTPMLVREGPEPAVRGPRLLERLSHARRTRHYSPRTEEAYVLWARRFIVFHGKRHPRDMGAEEVTRFLSSLAVEHQVSAATQNQALSGLLLLYKQVLEVELPWLDQVVRAKRGARLPAVMTREEVRVVLGHLEGTTNLVARLLYGAGLWLLECMRLRVKDLNCGRNEIIVRAAKGDRDRRTMLAASLSVALKIHVDAVRAQHERDLARGAGWIELPAALGRKYPNAGREWAWQ
jgi:site-specific recombinase XerD